VIVTQKLIPTNCSHFNITYPESIVGTRVREVNDKLEWLVVERLECQKNMVDQEITIHI